MMATETLVNAILDDILKVEGAAYTNHPLDRGGPTKYGITLATLRDFRRDPALQAADVMRLSEDDARRIYFDKYVVKPGFTQVLALMPVLGAKLVDVGVNCGPVRAGTWLQRALNAFNRSYNNPPDYPELAVDGNVGPATIGSLHTFAALRGAARAERVLARAVNVQQGSHYLALGAANAGQEAFMLGWFDNRVD
jgi:lysozyme family protein